MSWPGDGQWIASTAKTRGNQLGLAERRVNGPGPSRVVYVVRLGSTQNVESTHLVHDRDLLFDGIGYLGLRQQFADGDVLSLGAGTIIAEDIENQRIVANALTIQFVDELARLSPQPTRW